MTVSLCVLLWARRGLAEEFSAYEDRVLVLMGEHGGEVLNRARTDSTGAEPEFAESMQYAQESLDAELSGTKGRASRPIAPGE